MDVKVGDYVMHHMSGGPNGTLVRVLEETTADRFGVGYVQLVADSVVSGGTSWSWPASDFRPITDPLYLLAARLDAAGRTAAAARATAATKDAEANSLRGAIRAFLDARESARAVAAVDK